MVLFFDIDGTLWDYKNYIPESTKKAIKLAQQNGHKCFINTGGQEPLFTMKSFFLWDLTELFPHVDV